MRNKENTTQVTPYPLVIRRNQLKSIVGISPSSIDRLEREGSFPARRRIGAGTVGWLLHEVQEFLSSQPKVISKEG
jgi:prophage regulatory protein